MKGLQLAAIGNCAVASLITGDARHVWFSFPRLDGDPVFSSLLAGENAERGFMDVCVRDVARRSQAYVANTAVLETLIADAHGGEVRITDFAPRHERYGRSFRPPTIVRRIEAVSGRPRIRVRIRPMFDYGETLPAISFGRDRKSVV